MVGAEVVKAHRRFGMTRPWVLIPVIVTVAVTVLAALAAGSFATLVAWSLGGILSGLLLLMLDAKKKRKGGD